MPHCNGKTAAWANSGAFHRFWLVRGPIMSLIDSMRARVNSAAFLCSLFFTLPGLQSLSAQLPSLNDQPWIGHFAGIEARRFDFGITSHGKMMLLTKDNRDKRATIFLAVQVELVIEEIYPDGRVSARTIKEETLTSADSPTDKFEKTVIKGQVTGEAAFELHVEQNRGAISVGGRITDPGTLTKNPIRLALRVRFPTAYRNTPRTEKKDEKVFLKRIKDDRIDLKWTDGKRKRQPFDEEVDASSVEINGPGIASVAIQISAYRDRKFEIEASEHSVMSLFNGKPGQLHEGFTIRWLPDAEKDPEGNARLTIVVK